MSFLFGYVFGKKNLSSLSTGDTEADLEAALPSGKAYIVESGVYVKDGDDYLIEDI